MERRLSQLLLALVLAGCGIQSTVRPLPPAPVGKTDCERAQSRLDALQCSTRKTPKGDSFKSFCLARAEVGIDVRADCIAQVTDCSDVNRAYRTPQGEPCQNTASKP